MLELGWGQYWDSTTINAIIVIIVIPPLYTGAGRPGKSVRNSDQWGVFAGEV